MGGKATVSWGAGCCSDDNKRICLLCPDSSRHKPDQSRASPEEEPGGVHLPGEGHADAEQLPGGLLDGQPEEPRPQGEHLC